MSVTAVSGGGNGTAELANVADGAGDATDAADDDDCAQATHRLPASEMGAAAYVDGTGAPWALMGPPTICVKAQLLNADSSASPCRCFCNSWYFSANGPSGPGGAGAGGVGSPKPAR